MTERPRVVIVSDGIAGLTAALRLARAADPPDVTVLEADARVGGKLRSVRVGGLELESGADSFVARKPWAVDLCREVGLGAELRSPASSGVWLWTSGGLVRMLRNSAFGIPGDIGDVLKWPGLSRGGARRAARDLLIRRRRGEADESLGALLRRRLGGAGEPQGRGETGDAAAHDHDPRPLGHEDTSDRWSRTTWAKTSTNPGSALGIRVRSNRTPASSAIARASMSRSNRISR